MKLYKLDDLEYLLTDSESKEVEEYSANEPNDDKYNAWFKKFTEDHHITPRSDYKRAEYWSRLPSGLDKIANFVSIHQAVTTLVRVARPSVEKSNVRFVEKDKGSYEAGTINIPVGPIEEAKTVYESIDGAAGFSIHEAFRLNSKSPDVTARAVKVTFDNAHSLELLKNIADVLEDGSVNRVGLRDNPGFTDYIDNAYDYVFRKNWKGYKLPSEWPPTQEEQFAAIVGGIVFQKKLGDGSDKPYASKIRDARAIFDKYVNSDRLSNSTDQAMNLRKAVKDIESLLDGTPPKPKSEEDQPQPKSAPNGSIHAAGNDNSDGLSQKQVAEVQDMAALEATMNSLKDNEFAKGAGLGIENDVLVYRPLAKAPGKRKVTSGEILKADAMLRLAKTRERNEERFVTSGDLDEEEIYRLTSLRDPRVFIDATEEQEEEAVVYFGIDCSGSMGGRSIEYATDLAWLLAHSIDKKKYVDVKVFGWTDGVLMLSGDNSGYGASRGPSYHGGCVIARIYEPGDPIDRVNLLAELDMGGTPEAEALATLGKMIYEEPAVRKYLFILCDGSPGNSRETVSKVRQAIERKGVTVIQVNFSRNMRSGDMYKNVIPYVDNSQVVRALAKILDKAL